MATGNIDCPCCGKPMPAGMFNCPCRECRANIPEEIEFLRTIVESTTSSKDEKAIAREKLNELEKIYCKK